MRPVSDSSGLNNDISERGRASVLGRIVGNTSSGQFISSLLSHSAQLFCIAVVNFTILLLFHFDGLGRLECEGYIMAQST